MVRWIYIYITNQGENTVSVIDLNKLTIQKKISVGKFATREKLKRTN